MIPVNFCWGSNLKAPISQWLLLGFSVSHNLLAFGTSHEISNAKSQPKEELGRSNRLRMNVEWIAFTHWWSKGKPWVHYEPGLCFPTPYCSFSFFGGNGIWGGATRKFLLTLTPSFQQIQAFSCVFPNLKKTLDSESRYSAFHTFFLSKNRFLNSKKTGWNNKF